MIDVFDTVILAGGVGSRLRSVVSDRPKCLAEINGRPFLSYLLDRLSRAGLHEAILGTGYLADQVATTFGQEHRGLALRYSREDRPLGTGGAVKLALKLCRQEYVLVINGDSFLDFDWHKFFQWFDLQTMQVGMVVAWQDDCRRYGQVEISDDGQVLAFKEKSEIVGAGWINAGIYLIRRSLLVAFTAADAFSLERDFFPAQMGRGFYALGFRDRFIDIGTPDSYRSSSEFFATGPRG
jgi:D-glycero-alpha-D-manno-heptose 1-phosphate guanylyltransferase